MQNSFHEAMENGVDILRRENQKKIRVFHHNDSDGLTSGAILKSALSREGYSVEALALEKPYPKVLERILSGSEEIIFFADFAGKIAPQIAELNQRRNL